MCDVLKLNEVTKKNLKLNTPKQGKNSLPNKAYLSLMYLTFSSLHATPLLFTKKKKMQHLC